MCVSSRMISKVTTRRKWFIFERPYTYEPEPYTYKYDPVLPRPEPWRKSYMAEVEKTYLVPVEFAYRFADKDQIANNRIRVPEKIAELKASIAVEGLKLPGIMVLDENGKLRYHDGYHRLTAILELEDFDLIPVVFRRSTGKIKAFGRPMVGEAEIIFAYIDADR